MSTTLAAVYLATASLGQSEQDLERAGALMNWLEQNRHESTGLPYSHVGDKRFEHWTITYDAAVSTLAYLASGRVADATRILDFYINNKTVWRLGGVIEAFVPGKRIRGVDWSIRTGANVWLGIAAYHAFKQTGESRYLELATRIGDLAMSLQSTNASSADLGGIALGPRGDKRHAGDQRLGHSKEGRAFDSIYSTEINIDAYALFSFLQSEDGMERFAEARKGVYAWLRRRGHNASQHRFNRGGGDDAIATDTQSWGISSLGVDALNAMAPGLAESMAKFVEEECMAAVTVGTADGSDVVARGVDFVGNKDAARLNRDPLISPEWTFQLVNAYLRLSRDFRNAGDAEKSSEYEAKRKKLLDDVMQLAVTAGEHALAMPYATAPEALIGHENRTPRSGNMSAISAAYGVLALLQYDPLALDSTGP